MPTSDPIDRLRAKHPDLFELADRMMLDDPTQLNWATVLSKRPQPISWSDVVGFQYAWEDLDDLVHPFVD